MPKWKHEERKCIYTFSAMCRPFEISYISRGDCFAAQIDSSFALDCAMEDKAAGRCPPIVRLLSCLGSFHFSFHDLRLLRNRGVAQYAEHLIVINIQGTAELLSRSCRHGSHPFRGRLFRQQQIHKGVCRLCVIAMEIRRYA